MSKIVSKPVVKILEKLSLAFLKLNPEREMEQRIQKKITRMSETRIGKELGISRNKKQADIPLTNYDQYKGYYESPSPGDFIYPLKEYVNVTTSGTMSKPKKYLFPRVALKDNMRKTLIAKLLLYTHDGEKVTLEIGDTIYANLPGGSQITNHYYDIGGKQSSLLVKRCPNPELPFDSKVDYFIKHHDEIDVAYMTIPTLFDEVIPRVGELNLKGFVVQDSAANVFKERIKKVTGGYPKVSYGSTEALACSVPSIENPGGFILDWRIVYPEFISMKDREDYSHGINPETVTLNDVEKGKLYNLVVSPYLTEIHRYLMPDIFECISQGDSVLETNQPVFKYYSRGDRLIVLHNFTRIAEEELIQIMVNTGIPHVDFTARREPEGYRDYLKIYIELLEPKPIEEVHRKIGEELQNYDKDWRDLKNYLKYDPLKVHLLPRGSFKRFLSRKKGMYRIDRTEMRDERLQLLLST
jgi:hypothetical protein